MARTAYLGLALVGLACLLGLTTAKATNAMADDVDGDAKPACLTLGNLVKAGDTAAIKTFIPQVSSHLMANQFSGMITLIVNQAWDKTAVSEGPFLLAERNYAESIHYAWYLLINAGKPFYLRCDSARSQDRWQINGIQINTDPNEMQLP